MDKYRFGEVAVLAGMAVLTAPACESACEFGDETTGIMLQTREEVARYCTDKPVDYIQCVYHDPDQPEVECQWEEGISCKDAEKIEAVFEKDPEAICNAQD